MIPILFEDGTTSFTTNGLGRLVDCIRCIVTEERNGVYECEFDYPVTGKLFGELSIGRIVACTHDDKGDIQPFVIYRRSVPDLNGVVTFYASHISYMLNDIVVMPFTASSVSTALQGIKTNSVNTNPFTFWTDKSTVVSYNSKTPRLARAMLGGEENSILDAFGGGEYEFDKFEVKLYANRGTDSGVEIRYGKNLSDLSQDIDNSGTFNAIVPFWSDTDGHLVTLPEKIISYAESGERVDAAPMDLSEYFEEQPTQAQLRSAARARYERGDYALPSENIKVDFVQLWQTEEYKDYSALQRVGLCDTVSVIYPIAGVEKIKQKVIRVVYNVLLDRYDEIELGTLSATLGQAIKQEILQEVPTSSMMEAAIQYATDMIRGGLGGYVVMTPGENGYPQEILIMDTPDINTAVNVWRFNQGGLGHSSNGYEGPFSDIALTADGKINANLITTGILNANLIRAGVLQDVYGNVSWNFATGILNMTRGSINLGNGSFIATDAGRLTSIGGGTIRDPSSNTVFNLDSGLLTINKGSINLGNGNFIATDAGKLTSIGGGLIRDPSSNTVFNLDSGLLTINKGSINLGNGNFIATDAGRITAIGGGVIRDPNSNTVFNLDSGLLTIKKGLINLGDGSFVATDTGSLTAKVGQIGNYTISNGGLVYKASNNKQIVEVSPATIRNAYVSTSNFIYGASLESGNLKFYKGQNASDVDSATEYASIGTGYYGGSGSYRAALTIGTPYAYPNNVYAYFYDLSSSSTPISFMQSASFTNITASGTKNRRVDTPNYSDRLLYCYETPTPLFGDVGEATLDEDGICYVDIDDIFSETIAENVEYQVFLQAEGEGTCYIAEKKQRYFIIKGTPSLKVAWELKAKQRDYDTLRLEPSDRGLYEYESARDDTYDIDSYIKEQEALLYGND